MHRLRRRVGAARTLRQSVLTASAESVVNEGAVAEDQAAGSGIGGKHGRPGSEGF
jgi:hypothetical protein